MTRVNLTIELSEDIEEKARAAGLLTGEKLSEMIEAELERQRQREEAGARLSRMMAVLSDDFRAEYGHLSEDEALAMIDQWIDEADDTQG